MIDWLLSFDWIRNALIKRGWTPPNELGGGPPVPKATVKTGGGPPVPPR